MATPAVWVLNLDADFELAAPSEGRAFTPSRALSTYVARSVTQARQLFAPSDVLIDDLPPGAGAGYLGRAWCPTPRARALLSAAGVEPEPAPPFAVLRAVNSRGFNTALGELLPGAGFFEGEGALDAVRERVAVPSCGRGWLLKQEFSVAGRGQRRVHVGVLTEADERWTAAALRGGGLQVEPCVEVLLEFVVHGRIDRGGATVVAVPCVQVCVEGAWTETRRALPGELRSGEFEALENSAAQAAHALAGAGYFGPFGIDAFRWRDAKGAIRLQARTEINARYTMGWRVGMGSRRSC